jgi:hypothetical protein
MRKTTVFITLIVSTAIASALGIFVVLCLFNSREVTLGTMLRHFALPALVYMAVFSALLGRNAPLFSSPDFNEKGEKFSRLLKKIGAIPIKSIGTIVLLQVLFLSVIFLTQRQSLGVPQDRTAFLYAACFAAGMVIGVFFYIISDSIVSHTLMQYNITFYPRELHENRQGAKTFIIPLAASLFSIVFTFSVTVI